MVELLHLARHLSIHKPIVASVSASDVLQHLYRRLPTRNCQMIRYHAQKAEMLAGIRSKRQNGFARVAQTHLLR